MPLDANDDDEMMMLSKSSSLQSFETQKEDESALPTTSQFPVQALNANILLPSLQLERVRARSTGRSMVDSISISRLSLLREQISTAEKEKEKEQGKGQGKEDPLNRQQFRPRSNSLSGGSVATRTPLLPSRSLYGDVDVNVDVASEEALTTLFSNTFFTSHGKSTNFKTEMVCELLTLSFHLNICIMLLQSILYS